VLQRQLEDPNARIIITTIQKLARFVAKNKKHPVYDAHVVVIFDECHRSQFGDMHTTSRGCSSATTCSAFTGTPIFAENTGHGRQSHSAHHEQAFGDKLHTYTIVDAINDKNVLPFRIDYINTIKTQADASTIKRCLPSTPSGRSWHRSASPRSWATSASTSTRRPSAPAATATTASAWQASTRCLPAPPSKRPNATTPNSPRSRRRCPRRKAAQGRPDLQLCRQRGGADGLLGEEEFETEGLDRSSRDFLEAAIQDYNALFGTSFDTSADKFQNYYKDLSQRLKKRELDVVIVVNMFLTGFDATTLNTLWADKNLKAHGLIQAYSRTNRILNSVKSYGNIVSFRNLEQATNDALALFGNKDAKGIVLLKPYADYYKDYEQRIGELVAVFRWMRPSSARRHRRRSSSCLARSCGLKNILTAFDDFAGNEILSRARFPGLPEPVPEPVRGIPRASDAEKESHQRRCCVRDRADQTGRNQRRLHPDAGGAVPAGQGQRAKTRRFAPPSSARSMPARRCATKKT
jgi:type I restriction enzyme R subunit